KPFAAVVNDAENRCRCFGARSWLVPTETIRDRISCDRGFVLDLFRHFRTRLHSLLPGLDGTVRLALLAGVVRGSNGCKQHLSVRLLQYDVSRDALERLRSVRATGLE